MKHLFKIFLAFFFAVSLVGVFAQKSQAHGHVYVGGGVAVGPAWGYYGPGWYDPWGYGPSYYYYEPPPNYGYLKTDVEPDKAEVWVDNRFFGTADDFDGWFHHLKLPLGIHTAQFRLKGYKTYSVSFTVTPGDTTTISMKLPPVPIGEENKAELGNLKIIAPPGSSIYVDDTYSGTTSGEWGRDGVVIPLQPGRHSVRVSKEGYEDYHADVLVSPDQTVSVKAEMKQASQPAPAPEPTPAPAPEAAPAPAP